MATYCKAFVFVHRMENSWDWELCVLLFERTTLAGQNQSALLKYYFKFRSDPLQFAAVLFAFTNIHAAMNVTAGEAH